MLTSILGLAPQANDNRLCVVKPRLPFWLDFVRVSGLRVGEQEVDLLYERKGSRTAVKVTGGAGKLEVVQTDRWPRQ